MLYVSQIDRKNNMYGVTDTDDGVTQFVNKAELLDAVKSGVQVNGVAGNTISVVSLTNQVMNVGFAKIEKQVDALVAGWSVETCMEVGRKGSFVSKLKKQPESEVRRITKEHIYPSSIRDAVQNAAQYTNAIREVDVSNQKEVIDALANNVCLVLQHKTNGVLTSFVCSAGLKVLDFVYAPGFFDAVYLTKQLYGYTYNASKLRPRSNRPVAKSPDIVNVFSCSLRFRNDGVRHDKGNLVLSSPFYSVNLSKLFCMYILDNPGQLGDTITSEFRRGKHTGLYDFDFDMFQEVMQDVRNGVNTFETSDQFTRYLDVKALPDKVTLDDVIDRYKRDFNYMRKLRQVGVSFVK